MKEKKKTWEILSMINKHNYTPLNETEIFNTLMDIVENSLLINDEIKHLVNFLQILKNLNLYDFDYDFLNSLITIKYNQINYNFIILQEFLKTVKDFDLSFKTNKDLFDILLIIFNEFDKTGNNKMYPKHIFINKIIEFICLGIQTEY